MVWKEKKYRAVNMWQGQQGSCVYSSRVSGLMDYM